VHVTLSLAISVVLTWLENLKWLQVSPFDLLTSEIFKHFATAWPLMVAPEVVVVVLCTAADAAVVLVTVFAPPPHPRADNASTTRATTPTSRYGLIGDADPAGGNTAEVYSR
jgi:hypothetical protein